MSRWPTRKEHPTQQRGGSAARGKWPDAPAGDGVFPDVDAPGGDADRIANLEYTAKRDRAAGALHGEAQYKAGNEAGNKPGKH